MYVYLGTHDTYTLTTIVVVELFTAHILYMKYVLNKYLAMFIGSCFLQ